MALGNMRAQSEVETVLNALNDSSGKVRFCATNSLGRMNDIRVIEPLIEVIKTDPLEGMMSAAVLGLCEIDNPDATNIFLNALNDTNPNVRFAAACALGNIGDNVAVEPLIKSLKDEEGGVREVASIALGKIGDDRAVEPLINALNDPYDAVRIAAANSLNQIEQ